MSHRGCYSDSSEYSSKACSCGRDESDSCHCCRKCGQYSCNRCRDTAKLILTDIGLYCTNCLENKIMIYPDSDSESELEEMIHCCKCRKELFKDAYGDGPIYIANVIICRECLTTLIVNGLNKDV